MKRRPDYETERACSIIERLFHNERTDWRDKLPRLQLFRDAITDEFFPSMRRNIPIKAVISGISKKQQHSMQ